MSNLKEKMIGLRHELHQYPETAFEEFHTSKMVADELEKMGYTVHRGIGGTGVVAEMKLGDSEKIVGLRADMDAINLCDQGEHDHVSTRDGKLHGCGHDGHTITLLWAAQLISERKNFNGTVRLIFQPAEEPGKGADAMIKDGFFERFPLDEFYGVHNSPAYPLGTLHTCVGGFCSSEDNFKIEIHGRGGHASAPEHVVDPLVIAAEIILALQTIVSRNTNPLNPIVVSCTEMFTDGGHNAIPSNVTILGDARSYSHESQELIENRMRTICENIATANGASCDVTYTHEFTPTINAQECVAAAISAANAVNGITFADGNCKPFMGSEDFGRFLEEIPGCFAFLGTGTGIPEKDAPLHNSHFDYNDEALEIGAEYFAELIRQRLQ